MSVEAIEVIEILQKFGLEAVLIYMVFRLENRMIELKDAVAELCAKLP